jgi:hypothetical protein
MECQFCKKILSSKSALNTHQRTARYCLNMQGKQFEDVKNKFKCELCGKTFLNNNRYKYHKNICTSNRLCVEENENLKSLITDLEKNNSMLQKENEMLKQDKKELQHNYTELSLTAVSRDFQDETTIDIDMDMLSDGDFTVEETDTEDEPMIDIQLSELEITKGFTIEHRQEDGYINVTNLCKAGGKLFKNWKKTQKTKAFIQVLSNEVLNGTALLIKHKTGYGSEQCTWVHPQVAINIAQWISPQFDVKVSGWIYEIMMTGKVDITNTTSFKKLQEDNKQKNIKIQYLTKKYVKSQPRVQYKEKYVIYVLTTALMKKERRYILGKATNLTSRLSVYNKSDEHQVVYYQSCGDEETMGCVENMVFQCLKEYREQANRERFNLPEKEEIELFTNTINKSVEFFKNKIYKISNY